MMKSKNIYVIAVCLGLCASSLFFLYRFYNPPVSGLTDEEARKQGFANAQRAMDLGKSSDWDTNAQNKLSLLKQVFKNGTPMECITGVGNMSRIKNKETARQAIALLKQHPTLWVSSKDSPRILVEFTLEQFILSGNGEVVQELKMSADPNIRAVTNEAIQATLKMKRK